MNDQDPSRRTSDDLGESHAEAFDAVISAVSTLALDLAPTSSRSQTPPNRTPYSTPRSVIWAEIAVLPERDRDRRWRGPPLQQHDGGPRGLERVPRGWHRVRTEYVTGPGAVGSRQCIVNLVQFEGRHTRDAIKIEAESELVFINVSPPGHAGGVTHTQRGIWISPIVRHVRFIGGWCNNYTGGFAGSCAIEVANGAKDIYFDDVGISQPHDQPYLSEVKFPDPFCLCGPPGSGEAGGEPLSERVRGHFTFGIYEPNVTAGTIAVAMIPVLGQGPAASVKGHDVRRVSNDSTAIQTLKHGYDGQKLTLLGQAAGPDSRPFRPLRGNSPQRPVQWGFGLQATC